VPGDRLTADTIVYRDRLEMVTAYGNAAGRGRGAGAGGGTSLLRPGAPARDRAGRADQITEGGANWYRARRRDAGGHDRVFATHGVFTTCDLEIPHYHFESDRIMVIRDRILVARPARLYFGQVPVMVLPFVVQNLERGRRSGLLTPRFGVNDVVRTSSGYHRQISDLGFYWAINDYMDAQVERRVAERRLHRDAWATSDYNWRRQFLSGHAGLDRYWREDGRREFSLNTSSSWQPDERTQMSFSGRYASSSELIRDVSYDPRDATQDLMSTFSLGGDSTGAAYHWAPTGASRSRRETCR
jgi:hypothetical protein